jgi:hypothetical protein
MAGVENYGGTLILAIIIIGFILVTVMMQALGRNFSWHKELD